MSVFVFVYWCGCAFVVFGRTARETFSPTSDLIRKIIVVDACRRLVIVLAATDLVILVLGCACGG